MRWADVALPFGEPRPIEAPRRRLDQLTSLRWFAAFGVFMLHAYWLIKVVFPWYEPSGLGGASAGVSFFFMLSGFVLAWARSDSAGARPFWQNRFARVWPLHAVALFAALSPPWLIHGKLPQWKLVPPVFFLVQGWIPKVTWYYAPNTPSWTLSCEAFFYAMFPWLHRRIDRHRRPVALLVGLLVLIWAIPVLTLPLKQSTAIWVGYIFPIARLPEFCVGIVLCRLVREGRFRWTNPWIPGILVLAGVWSDRWLPDRFVFVAWTVVPLAWLLAAVATRSAQGRRSVLDARPLVWLGEISFAFYLIHALVVGWLIPGFPVFFKHGYWSHPAPLIAVMLAISIVLAWGLHRFIEIPVERRLRAPRSDRPPPVSPPDHDVTPAVIDD